MNANPQPDAWRRATVPQLIEHIVERFHARHREQLPHLIQLARRVEQVHADKPDCPAGLADCLETLLQELESHMMKEEQILFPMLSRGMHKQAQPPIAVMRFEHDRHDDALATIDAITAGLVAPGHACNTWRTLYDGLAEFKNDLNEHIHLENDVLFAQSTQAAGEQQNA